MFQSCPLLLLNSHVCFQMESLLMIQQAPSVDGIQLPAAWCTMAFVSASHAPAGENSASTLLLSMRVLKLAVKTSFETQTILAKRSRDSIEFYFLFLVKLPFFCNTSCGVYMLSSWVLSVPYY